MEALIYKASILEWSWTNSQFGLFFHGFCGFRVHTHGSLVLLCILNHKDTHNYRHAEIILLTIFKYPHRHESLDQAEHQDNYSDRVVL